MAMPPARPVFSKSQRAMGFDSPCRPTNRQVLMTSRAFVHRRAITVNARRAVSKGVMDWANGELWILDSFSIFLRFEISENFSYDDRGVEVSMIEVYIRHEDGQ